MIRVLILFSSFATLVCIIFSMKVDVIMTDTALYFVFKHLLYFMSYLLLRRMLKHTTIYKQPELLFYEPSFFRQMICDEKCVLSLILINGRDQYGFIF